MYLCFLDESISKGMDVYIGNWFEWCTSEEHKGPWQVRSVVGGVEMDDG